MNRPSATAISALFVASSLAFSLPAVAGDDADCHFHDSKPASQQTVSGCAAQRQQEDRQILADPQAGPLRAG